MMKFRFLAIATTAAIALSGCTSLPGTSEPTSLATASLSNSAGNPIGTARLVDYGTSRAMRLSLTGLPSGTHGFHLHTTGTCTAPDFQSAGGHLNPGNKEHGSLNPAGKHLGDLPNIEVPANGMLTTEIPLEASSADLMTALFDSDGTAVMVHSGADDYRTDPSGDAGSRIACGVLVRS